MTLKGVAKSVIPPVVFDLLRRAKTPVISFSGDYESWEAAAKDAAGYDAKEILERVLASTRKVVNGEAQFERDSVAFDSIEYSWPLLACLLQIGLERESLRVVDFGGALGGSLRQNWKFFSRLKIPISWNVVEQAHFVQAGRAEFTTEILNFHQTIEDAAVGGIDAAVFCSSLCYVADPTKFLNDVKSAGAQYLLIDRLPIVTRGRHRIALQKVGEPIYKASYPVRFFDESVLINSVLSEWRLIERWCSDLQPGGDTSWQGLFLERK
jgi:putative methyltransferase (TIGR04325 family)